MKNICEKYCIFSRPIMHRDGDIQNVFLIQAHFLRIPYENLKGRKALFKKKLAQVFSCEFCEISKNTFSYRTPPVAASER